MKKRGQVTLIIIFSLIVVLLVIILLFFKGETLTNVIKNVQQPSASLSPEAKEIQNLNRECIEGLANEALFLIGSQGGYIIPSSNSITINTTSIAFGYYNGKSVLVSKDKISSQISNYIRLGLNNCTDYKKFNVEIKKEQSPSVKTKILDDSVEINTYFPMEISKTNSTTYYLDSDYNLEIPIKLGIIYDTSKTIISNEIKNSNIIDINSLLDSKVDISILAVDNNTIIYALQDKDFRFMFANSFT